MDGTQRQLAQDRTRFFAGNANLVIRGLPKLRNEYVVTAAHTAQIRKCFPDSTTWQPQTLNLQPKPTAGIQRFSQTALTGRFHGNANWITNGTHKFTVEPAAPDVQSAPDAAINSNQNLVICLKECLFRFGLESLIQRYKITTVVSMRQYPSIPSAGYEAIEDLAKRNPVITVVLIADNPSFEGWSAPAIFGPKSIPEKRDDVEVSQFGALTRLTQLDRDLENVRMVPVLDLLCGSVNCETEIDGRIVYSDDNHLSAFGAQLLAHRINSALMSTP